LFYLVAILVFLADQFFKLLTRAKLIPGQSVPAIDGILHFTYVQNTGAAFGFLRDQRPLLVLVGVTISIIIIHFYLRAKKDHVLLKISLAAILGGSLGNLFDRILLGYVVDYIDFRIFPVFNLSDVAINLGVLFIFLDIFFKGSECTR